MAEILQRTRGILQQMLNRDESESLERRPLSKEEPQDVSGWIPQNSHFNQDQLVKYGLLTSAVKLIYFMHALIYLTGYSYTVIHALCCRFWSPAAWVKFFCITATALWKTPTSFVCGKKCCVKNCT